MKASDIGTMFLVKAEVDPINDDEVSFQKERNVFAEVRETLEDPEIVLRDNNYAYCKYKNKYYVVGEDVFKVHEIESLFKRTEGASSYFSEVRRPMKNGLINTAEEKMSIAIIQEIIRRLIGKSSYDGEVLCFCVPGDPVNSDSNVLFHRTMLTNFIKSLGYVPECINEALAIVFSECPTADDPDEPEGVAKFSGVALSFGSGMCNAVLSWKQLPLISFSMTHSGDYIDREAAKIAGVDVSTITKFKEKNLDLSNIDSSNLKESALDVYYGAMIENAMKHFASRFEKLDDKISAPMEIVVAGGTASVPGFIDKFKEVLDRMELPFNVKGVRLAKNPLYAVANGCLAKAISVESKPKGKTKPKAEKEPKTEKAEKKNKENRPQKIKLDM